MASFLARIPATVVLVIAAAGLVGTVIALLIAIPLSGRVAEQAESGERARERQIAVAPTACKMAQDSYRRGVITRVELETYAAGALSPCAIPPVP